MAQPKIRYTECLWWNESVPLRARFPSSCFLVDQLLVYLAAYTLNEIEGPGEKARAQKQIKQNHSRCPKSTLLCSIQSLSSEGQWRR